MAPLRCKVGDLVVIVNCPPFPQNIGRFATVDSAVGEPVLRAVGADWWIKPQTTAWGRGFFSARECSELLCVMDADLRPIRPQADDAVDEIVAKVGPAPMTLTELLRREEVSHG